MISSILIFSYISLSFSVPEQIYLVLTHLKYSLLYTFTFCMTKAPVADRRPYQGQASNDERAIEEKKNTKVFEKLEILPFRVGEVVDLRKDTKK